MRLAVFESDRRRLGLVSGPENETVFDLTKAVELLSGRNDVMHAAPDDLMTIIRSPDAYSSLAKLAAQMMSDGAKIGRLSNRVREAV
jgi:hypothetical protein